MRTGRPAILLRRVFAVIPIAAPVGALAYVVVPTSRESAPLKISSFHWRIVGYLGAALVVLYVFAQWQQRTATEDQAVIQRAEQALAMGRSFRVRQAALAGRAKQALAASVAKERVIQALRGQLQQARTPQDTIRIQVVLVDSLTAQRDSLSLAEALQRARAERAEARVTLLEMNLQATLTVADCHIGGLSWLPRCPSRNLSALLGLGTGAILVLALHR